MGATQLSFSLSGTEEHITLTEPAAIVAGYTGRDAHAVQEHIDELAAIGIAPPPNVPMFYPVDATSVTSSEAIEVMGERTSGEIEPLYIRCQGRYYLGISSDHTDREVEAQDIGDSKRACPKPASGTVIPVNDISSLNLDGAHASSFVDGKKYQDGYLSALRTPADVIELLLEYSAVGDGDFICLGGTVPVIGGDFVYGTDWDIRLELPSGDVLEHHYTVQKGI